MTTINADNIAISTYELFHNNQIKVGNEIISKFETYNFVHLQAQMQSGKTGSSLFTAFQMIQQNKIDTFHVLSSISDTDLKNQWINKIQSHFDDYFNISSISDNLQLQYYNSLKTLLINSVYFGTNIKNIKSIEFLKNSLIILDEIHYGSSKNSIMSKLFERLGITSILEGEMCELLDTYNIKILAVTATAANLDSIYNNTEAPKYWGRVYMEPGDNYKGVLDYYKSNQIHSNFNINYENLSNLMNLLCKYKPLQKYMIFRAVTAKSDIIIQVCEALEIPYILYDRNNSTQFDNIEPNEFTCVIIKSKLRVGKELNKEHICAVYESSLSINTDTLLQGLLGRICGYNISNNIDVYIVTEHIEEIMNEFELINKPIAEASMTRTKFVKNYVASNDIHPVIKPGSMHT